jgi:hypothetical protein
MRVMNRRLRIYRGQTASPYGDLSDVGQLYLDNVPAAIAETSQSAFDPATQRPSIIRAIEGRVPAWADVELTDTLLDPATGFYYLIEDIASEPGYGYYPAVQRLTLRLRSGVTVAGETGGRS